MTLDKVAPGQGGVITQVGGEGVLRRRLLDMGLTPGTRVSVRKIAPMGDPIELFLRSYVPVSYTHLDVYKRQCLSRV